MNTEQSMQAFLDSLSQLPGSVLYRGEREWKGLPPGEPGEVLAIGSDGMPAWIHPDDLDDL